MKIYKSKNSNFFFLIPILIFFNIIVIIQGFPWFLTLFGSTFFVTAIIALTKVRQSVTYLIMNETLIVQGTFITKIIDIKTIQKIEKNNSFLRTKTDNATAPSHQALEIYYNKFETILISPADKKHFIADLVAINPAIEVKI